MRSAYEGNRADASIKWFVVHQRLTRGRPALDWKTFEPICSMTTAPVTGPVTTDPRAVTCNACRKVLKLPHVAEFDDDEEQYP
jgi:hypothetical protein